MSDEKPNSKSHDEANSLTPEDDPFASAANDLGKPQDPVQPVTPSSGTIDLVEPVSGPSGSFLRPGTKIDPQGRYIVEGEQLGRGGMGRVFTARDTKLNRPVAVKLQQSWARIDENADMYARRFQMEAMLPAQLAHPNIVVIYDIGCRDDDVLYYIMEYIEGSRDLDHRIRVAIEQKEFLSLDLVTTWFQQAASALKKLHSHNGAWHRDIKPENFLVWESEGDHFLKLIDFGVAHQDTENLTSTDALPGTVYYMPPEFFEVDPNGDSLALDSRSDLWMLGLLLYRCLTNKLVYASNTTVGKAIASFRSDRTLPILPSVHRPAIPPGWDTITLKLLERDRTVRYQSASEFLEDLKRVDQLPGYQGKGARTADDIARVNAMTTPGLTPSVRVEEKGNTLILDDDAAAPPPPEFNEPAHDPNPLAQANDLPNPSASPHQAPSDTNASSATVASSEAVMPSALHTRAGANNSHTPGSAIYNEDYAAALAEVEGASDASTTHARARLLVAASAVTAVLVGLGVAAHWLTASGPSFSMTSNPPAPQLNGAGAIAPPESEPVPSIFETQAAMTEVPATLISAQESSTDEDLKKALRGKYNEPAPAGPKQDAPKRAQKKRTGSAREPKAVDPPAPDNEWARIYGDAVLNTGALVIQADKTTDGTAPEVRGMRLPAKLVDNVASTPSGAPVVAKITKKTVLGPHVIPPGAEIHGRTGGSNGSRVLVSFDFVRLKTGRTITLVGVGRGMDGRLGVPGKKLIDERTGGSVAASGAGAAVGAAANELADEIGNSIAGSGVRASGGRAGQSAERFDESERIVMAKRGTSFAIYVNELSAER